MRVSLRTLQTLVESAIKEDRAANILRSEVSRVLGPTVIVDGTTQQIAEAANEWIDVLERTGRSSRLNFNSTVMSRFVNHTDPQVRKLAARVVPEKYLFVMANDRNHAVRATVARRVPLSVVKEMLKKFPKDDGLKAIYGQKSLTEAGLPTPKIQDEPFDMYGEDRMGDASRSGDGLELSEQWYQTKAFNLVQDYGGNIEYSWEEVAVHNLASSMKATSNVEIDEAKLLKAIKKLIEDKEDKHLKRDALKETISWLKSQDDNALLAEGTENDFVEEYDVVAEIMKLTTSPQTFIEKANEVFKIKESTYPAHFRKYRLGEDHVKTDSIPVIGYLPHNNGFRALDERALDTYCKHWSDRQQLTGKEPMKLEWSVHPDQVGKVSFTVLLK
jgi:hypothetical protein